MKIETVFPNIVIRKWQKLVDLLSATFDLPATLVTHVQDDFLKILASSITEGNPYQSGEYEGIANSYCEAVVKNNVKFLIPNALKDPDWESCPEIKDGLIAYLGLPLRYPNGKFFGTICILDSKENTFNGSIEEFLKQIKEVVELDIATYCLYENTSVKLESNLVDQFLSESLKKKSILDLESELNKQKHIQKVLQKKLNNFDLELNKKEHRYENIISSMTSALVVFQSIMNDEGKLIDARYIDMNPKNEEIIGYKKEDVLGKTILELFPETERVWLSNFETVIKNNKSLQFDSFHHPLNKYFSANVFPIEDNIFAISYHDNTDNELLKKKLKDSEKRYKTIFHESSSVMMLVDPEEGSIIDANVAAVRFYGYPKDKLLTMKMHDINIMSKKDLKKEINLATEKKKTHFLFKHQIASGELRDVEVYAGALIANGQTLLHSVIHDVTESQKAMVEVNRLSMAVDQSPVAVVITDTNGDILYCNPKHCELTGYSITELIGANSRILKSGKSNKSVYTHLWKTITSGRKWSGEFFNKKKNGSFYWESASIVPIKNDLGEIVNFLKIGEDITERKRLENQLSQSILKAEESDKLKSSFLSNLSHEVRTPLNGIMGFANLLISDGISDDERREYGEFVESSGNQLMLMMDNIIKMSTIESGNLTVKHASFSVSELLLDVESFYFDEAAKKQLRIFIECHCELRIINDKKRIRQVLDNLVRNAIKFTSDGQITLRAECNKNMLLLSVEDTGIGIAAQDQDKIFDRFRQIDSYSTREFEGTGLGLAVSKEIVTLLGGEIWVESSIGKGSKFIVTIPNIYEN